MQQIFVNQKVELQKSIMISGEDVKHLATVLRMRPGEPLRISTHEEGSYIGKIASIDKNHVEVQILGETASTELNRKIYLFQGIAKGERMDTVIEKAVELGAYEIIPVEMRYCVVKWDEKKKESRIRRYRTIAETAAKQSKRSIVPRIHDVMTFEEAVKYASSCELRLVPYECQEGMASTILAMQKIKDAGSVSLMIGPEGGFAGEEIAMVKDSMELISLGSRILRTDTAAITAMSMVMLACEHVPVFLDKEIE